MDDDSVTRLAGSAVESADAGHPFLLGRLLLMLMARCANQQAQTACLVQHPQVDALAGTSTR